jgi:hypothetical protein
LVVYVCRDRDFLAFFRQSRLERATLLSLTECFLKSLQQVRHHFRLIRVTPAFKDTLLKLTILKRTLIQITFDEETVPIIQELVAACAQNVHSSPSSGRAMEVALAALKDMLDSNALPESAETLSDAYDTLDTYMQKFRSAE